MEGDYWCVMSGYTVFSRIAGTNAATAALGGNVPLAADVIAADNEAAEAISIAAAKAAEEAGIPFMHITTDYAGEDAGQLQTRIEAFLETI